MEWCVLFFILSHQNTLLTATRELATLNLTERIAKKISYYQPLINDVGKAFIAHIRSERITVSAGHLAYVSLLSLVTVIMVFFMIMSAFPAFAEVRGQLENFIFTNFVPTAGDVVQDYMTDFVANASGMSAVSIVSLLVVALLLISNIDKTFNHIWRTQVQRPIIYTFAIYWMVITLGPFLIGSSIVVSSYLMGLTTFAEEYTPGLGTFVLKFIPSFAAIGAFLILYMIVPNRPVRAKYALCGALLATILFEISKKAFALYVTSFPSYEIIYGALAVIPILFIWVYLSWVVVLLGAVFTYSITVTCEARDELAEKERNGKLSNNDGDAVDLPVDNPEHSDTKQILS